MARPHATVTFNAGSAISDLDVRVLPTASGCITIGARNPYNLGQSLDRRDLTNPWQHLIINAQQNCAESVTSTDGSSQRLGGPKWNRAYQILKVL